MSYVRKHLFLTYTLTGTLFLCLVLCNDVMGGGWGGMRQYFAFLVQTCVYLYVINSCTSINLKNKCDLEFDDKIIMALRRK